MLEVVLFTLPFGHAYDAADNSTIIIDNNVIFLFRMVNILVDAGLANLLNN